MFHKESHTSDARARERIALEELGFSVANQSILLAAVVVGQPSAEQLGHPIVV